MSDLQFIISRLGNLSTAELEQLRRQIDLNLGLTGKRSNPGAGGHNVLSLDADWLLSGIYFELKRRGVMDYRLPMSNIRAIASNYERDAQMVRGTIEAHLGAKLSSRQRVALGATAARALVDYLCPPAPCNLRVLTRNVSKVPEALDASFPGYLSSGLLYCLLQYHNFKPQRQDNGL